MIPSKIDEKDFRYQIPLEEDLIQSKRKIDEIVAEYKSRLGLEAYEIEINYCLLCSIIIRIDERKDYYKHFHSTDTKVMKISRGKENALLAYWVVKYKPFRVKNIADEEQFYLDYRCSFNEVFAAMTIASFIIEEGKVGKDFFTGKKINALLYDLFNRDVSKEAMIMFVEAFVPQKA